MKPLLNKLLLLAFLLFSFNIGFCQEATNVSVKIADAIKTGNSKELASYFNSNIELTVIDNDGAYSKAQAEIIMKDFFTKNPPKEFSINHNGSSKDSSHFFIGSYKSNNQQSYRIYFLLKSLSGKMLIQQLQIQE